MTPEPTERRRTRRRRSVEEHGIVSARVRPGIDACLIDVSAAGALIETRHRLLPGRSIEIHFARDKRLPAVRGTVLRCVVARLRHDEVCYRGAIAFDRRLPWLTDGGQGYSIPSAERHYFARRRALATQATR